MHKDGDVIVNISREFLNSNGAPKHTAVAPSKPGQFLKGNRRQFLIALRSSCVRPQRLLEERSFREVRLDNRRRKRTLPFGGKYQLTPSQVMANLISDEKRSSSTCSVMAYGYNPFITEKSPYHGAYLAVVESVSKLIAAGASFEKVYLTFQEYFEKPDTLPRDGASPLRRFWVRLKRRRNSALRQ